MDNLWFLAAGAVVFLTAGVHVFAGGRRRVSLRSTRTTSLTALKASESG